MVAFKFALLAVSAGCALTIAGMYQGNDIVTGTGLSIVVGAVGVGAIARRKADK